MKIAVIGTLGKWSSEALAQEIAALVGHCPLIEMSEVSLDLGLEKVTAQGYDLTQFDALVVKKVAQVYSPNALDRLEVLRFLELRGVRIFSPVAGIGRLIDRLSCTATLAAGGIPMPETFVTESAPAAAEKLLEYQKAVLKPLYSTKARGMICLDSQRHGLKEIQEFQAAGNETLYLQRFVKGPGRDLGLSFLGGRYLGTYARVGNGDSWNSTTESGGVYRAEDPPEAWIALAKRAQSLFPLDFTCVDLIETEAGPKIFEVSAFGGFRGLQEALGLNVAALYAQYVVEKTSPRKA